MLDYQSSVNALHTRGVSFTVQQYLYVTQVVMGERMEVAYGLVYDRERFLHETQGDEEQEYFASLTREAETMLQQQECQQLQEMLRDSYQSDVQASVSSLQDYKFSVADVHKLLSNLLHNRAEDLDSASTRDVIALIKTLADQGALDGDGNSFSRHFIQVHDPFNALCTKCGREFEVRAGIDVICPHCKQVYRWSEDGQRFFPEVTKL